MKSRISRVITWGCILALPAAISAQEQQGSSTILVSLLGAPHTPVTEEGRQIGVANDRLTVAAGVHNLRVAGNDVCVYVTRGADAQVSFAGKTATIGGSGVYDCKEIASDIVIEEVPGGVSVSSSAGKATRDGSTVTIRVPLPGRVRVSTAGNEFSATQNDVTVGAKELLRYKLVLVPASPSLLSDTTLLQPPEEPKPPKQPAEATPPQDPGPKLSAARSRLSLIQSARGDYHLSVFSGIVAAAAIGYAVVRDLDSLTPWPSRRKSVLIPFWSGTAVGLLSAVAFGASESGKGKAGCSGSLTGCQQLAERDIATLESDKADYPNALAAAAAETARRQAEYRRLVADYPHTRDAWSASVRQVEKQNTTIREHRAENERRTKEWQAAVAAAGLVTVGRR